MGIILSKQTQKFEGPEKKLEVYLFSKVSFRSYNTACWERVVKVCGASIVSQMTTDSLDAYLLSESSLFVWNNKIVLITCGKSTLTNAIPEIIGIIGKQNIELVIYERKSFLHPNEQPSDFRDELQYMRGFFKGSQYRLGSAKNEHVHGFYSAASDVHSDNGIFQILMYDLDLQATKALIQDGIGVNDSPMVKIVKELFPGIITDWHLFHPSGFSMNGVKNGHYLTIHVSPQKGGSYASFETDMNKNDFEFIIKKIISVFKPGRFLMILRTASDENSIKFFLPLIHIAGGGCYQIIENSINELNYGCTIRYSKYNQIRKSDF